jgi:hypothetical protein
MKDAILRFGVLLILAGIAAQNVSSQHAFAPVVPKTWNERALASLEMPLQSAVFAQSRTRRLTPSPGGTLLRSSAPSRPGWWSVIARVSTRPPRSRI